MGARGQGGEAGEAPETKSQLVLENRLGSTAFSVAFDLVLLAKSSLNRRRGSPSEVAKVERDRLLEIEDRILETCVLHQDQDLLGDAGWTPGKPDVGFVPRNTQFFCHRCQLDKDVVMFGVMRVFVAAIFIDALDRDHLSAELAAPLGAVADENDSLTWLRIDRPIVGAKDNVSSRNSLVAGFIETAENLDGFLERPWTAAPAIVVLEVIVRSVVRGWSRVGADVRPLEVLLNPDQANAETLTTLLGVFQGDVA